MTDRQKEMLKKRAILEFLADNTDLTMEDIDSCFLIKKIEAASPVPPLLLSHYVLYIRLTNDINVLYIPKERFKVEEANHVDTDSEQAKNY